MVYIVRPLSLNGLSKRDDRTPCSFPKIDITRANPYPGFVYEFHSMERMLKGRTGVVAYSHLI